MTSFLAVLASELGDRTFIVTTILAMKHSKVSVFLGAMTAATLMISISGLIGISSSLIPKDVVNILSIGLFFAFGIQMLVEGESHASISLSYSHKLFLLFSLIFLHDIFCTLKQLNHPLHQTTAKSMSSTGDEVDVDDILLPEGEKVISSEGADKVVAAAASTPAGGNHVSATSASQQKSLLVSGVFVSTFTMNFFAEWGDKSQISVILLAAKENWVLVLTGALLGHLLANTLAVLGGAIIRDIISIRTGMHC